MKVKIIIIKTILGNKNVKQSETTELHQLELISACEKECTLKHSSFRREGKCLFRVFSANP